VEREVVESSNSPPVSTVKLLVALAHPLCVLPLGHLLTQSEHGRNVHPHAAAQSDLEVRDLGEKHAAWSAEARLHRGPPALGSLLGLETEDHLTQNPPLRNLFHQEDSQMTGLLVLAGRTAPCKEHRVKTLTVDVVRSADDHFVSAESLGDVETERCML
jgi:hypothetical protein